MTWPGFSFLIVGVLLNAAAQLLLKAGTNSLGVIRSTPTIRNEKPGQVMTASAAPVSMIGHIVLHSDARAGG